MSFVAAIRAIFALSAFCIWIHNAAAQTPQTLPPIVPHEDENWVLAHQHPGCPTNETSGEFISAIDASEPLNTDSGKVILSKAQGAGIKVVFRYYDWKNEGTRLAEEHGQVVVDPAGHKLHCVGGGTSQFYPELQKDWNPGESLLGKTLTAQERDTIFQSGFAIGIVFQHCSGMAATFADEKRAAFDAGRALSLAAELHQEPSTPIFFGVDDDFSEENDVKNIRSYFDVVAKRITDAHFIVGVYGSGLICDVVKKDHPQALCWLSQSKNFTDSDSAVTKKSYDIKQCLPRQWDGTKPDWDPNVFNDSRPKIRFWEKVAH